MSAVARAVQVAHVVTSATLFGVVVVDPTARWRDAPDYAGWLDGQQKVDRVMSRLAPPLFLSTLISTAGAGVVSAHERRGVLAGSRLLSAACVAAAVAVTLRVNEPLNAELRAWSPTGVPPGEWHSVRARWDAAHRARRVLCAVAAISSVGGLGVSRRTSRRRDHGF